MAGNPDEGFGLEESGAIATEAARGRTLDRQLADELEHRASTTRAVTSRYIHELGQRAPMPPGAEEVIVREAREGDPDARARLVEAFLPLIGAVARNYCTGSQVSPVELMQEGVVGLLRALERYDPALGVPFWGYASWWVRQAMQQLVAELSRPMVLSDRALRQLSQLKQAHAELKTVGGPTPTPTQLAQRENVVVASCAPSHPRSSDRLPNASSVALIGQAASRVATRGTCRWIECTEPPPVFDVCPYK